MMRAFNSTTLFHFFHMAHPRPIGIKHFESFTFLRSLSDLHISAVGLRGQMLRRSAPSGSSSTYSVGGTYAPPAIRAFRSLTQAGSDAHSRGLALTADDEVEVEGAPSSSSIRPSTSNASAVGAISRGAEMVAAAAAARKSLRPVTRVLALSSPAELLHRTSLPHATRFCRPRRGPARAVRPRVTTRLTHARPNEHVTTVVAVAIVPFASRAFRDARVL